MQTDATQKVAYNKQHKTIKANQEDRQSLVYCLVAFLRHPASKQSASILSTTEPARGLL